MEINVTRKRGDTVPDVFTVSKGRTPANIAGCTFKLTLDTRKSPTDSTTQVYQLVGTVSALGKVSFKPTALQADKVGYFYYDIEMVDSYGDTQTILEGTYTYTQDITK